MADAGRTLACAPIPLCGKQLAEYSQSPLKEEDLGELNAKEREVWALCRVPRAEVCYLRYTLESYEGLCIPTTLPGGEGLVRLLTSEGKRSALAEALSSLSRELTLEVVEWGWGPPL